MTFAWWRPAVWDAEDEGLRPVLCATCEEQTEALTAKDGTPIKERCTTCGWESDAHGLERQPFACSLCYGALGDSRLTICLPCQGTAREYARATKPLG